MEEYKTNYRRHRPPTTDPTKDAHQRNLLKMLCWSALDIASADDLVDGVSSRARSVASPRPLKNPAPEPFGTRGQEHQDRASARFEQRPLQPGRPAQSRGKSLVATRGNLLRRFFPSQLTFAEFCERLYGKFSGFESHRHAVARHGRNHGQGITNATFIPLDCALRTQAKTRHRPEGILIELRDGQTRMQQ